MSAVSTDWSVEDCQVEYAERYGRTESGEIDFHSGLRAYVTEGECTPSTPCRQETCPWCWSNGLAEPELGQDEQPPLSAYEDGAS